MIGSLRRNAHLVVALLVGVVLASPAARAQEVFAVVPPVYLEERDLVEPYDGPIVHLNLGLRTWLSYGHSWISYAGVNGVPDVMSELHWRRVRNPMLELSADTLWFERLVVRADLGIGASGRGHLRAQDFAGGGHSQLISETDHPVNADNLYYFNFDVGWRLATWRGFRHPDAFLAVDALLGYQHWSEKYVAQGGTDIFPGDRTFPPGDAIASRFSWDNFRMGVRSLWQIRENLSLESRLFLVPYTEFENVDIHYLRTDLLRDPTFIDCASGGFGYMADVTLAWEVLPRLGLELGYRIWDMHVGDGISITRTPTGDFVSPLNHANTVRHGVLLGARWRF
jgi:hypothetical protein